MNNENYRRYLLSNNIKEGNYILSVILMIYIIFINKPSSPKGNIMSISSKIICSVAIA